MTRPAHATVHLEAIKHNYRLAKSQAPQAKAAAILKANAYGHGAVTVARALAAEADGFGVACLEEAVQLREAGISQPILLLEGYFEADELAEIDRLNLDTVIHTQQQIDQLRQATLSRPLNVWLKVDTGMGRIGFPPRQLDDAFQQLKNSDKVASLVLMTHLARADETRCDRTDAQIALFRELSRNYRVPTSLANSPGILAWPDSHGDWLRPGMMLYGASPLDEENAASRQLQPGMTMSSAVIAVKEYQTGDCIGYGGAFRCQRPTRMAVVAMGYGDGYPRMAPEGTPVLVNGQRCGLAGRVSMDMLTVDVTELASVNIGDPVILWGKGLPVEEVARHCGTIPYELVTRLTGRARLVYQGDL